MKTMLCVYAHPDDESFAVGGTIAQYAKRGWDIYLLVVSGEEDDQRRAEMKKAGDFLGVKEIQFLELPQSKLSASSPGTIEDPVLKIMDKLLPDIVITHDQTGGNNDPDHSKVCYAVTYAFQNYASYLAELQDKELLARGRGKIWRQAEYQRAFGETLQPSKEPKLYYSCVPQSSVQYLMKEKQIPEESFGKPSVGVPDKNITTIIDIGETQLDKGKALLSYESRSDAVDHFLSFAGHPQHKEECYVLRMQGIYEVMMGKTDRIADSL